MVCRILFPESNPPIKEMEEPIIKAEGFREGLRDLDDSEVNIADLNLKLPNLNKRIGMLDNLATVVKTEIDLATRVTTVRGLVVDTKRFTGILDFVGTAITSTVTGALVVAGKYVNANHLPIIAGVTGVVSVAGTQFVKKVKAFQRDCEAREALLKMLQGKITPYKKHLQSIKERILADDLQGSINAFRSGIKAPDQMSPHIKEPIRLRRISEDWRRKNLDVESTGDGTRNRKTGKTTPPVQEESQFELFVNSGSPST